MENSIQPLRRFLQEMSSTISGVANIDIMRPETTEVNFLGLDITKNERHQIVEEGFDVIIAFEVVKKEKNDEEEEQDS